MISNNGSIDIAKVSQPFEFLLSSTLSVFFPRAFEKKKSRGCRTENQFAASGIEYLSINGGPSKRKIKVSAKLFTR